MFVKSFSFFVSESFVHFSRQQGNEWWNWWAENVVEEFLCNTLDKNSSKHWVIRMERHPTSNTLHFHTQLIIYQAWIQSSITLAGFLPYIHSKHMAKICALLMVSIRCNNKQKETLFLDVEKGTWLCEKFNLWHQVSLLQTLALDDFQWTH